MNMSMASTTEDCSCVLCFGENELALLYAGVPSTQSLEPAAFLDTLCVLYSMCVCNSTCMQVWLCEEDAACCL